MSFTGTVLLAFDDFSLVADGRRATFEVQGGEAWAIMGRAAAGKSLMLDVATGDEPAPFGRVVQATPVTAARLAGHGRRQTPQSIATNIGKRAKAGRTAEALTALGLWDCKSDPISELTPSQVVACDVLACLLACEGVGVLDGHLDALDPWALAGALELMGELRAEGMAFLVSTNRADIASELGHIVVLRSGAPVFTGSVRDLLAESRPSEVRAECDDQSTIRSMIDPLVLTAVSADGSLVLRTGEGHELAAKLLRDGYGIVEAVAVTEPSVSDAIRPLG